MAIDLSDFTLALAAKVGADRAINTAKQPEALSDYGVDKGTFDILYECSGAAAALVAGMAAVRPRGIIIQLGLGGDMSLPMMAITAKELELRGSFRFHRGIRHRDCHYAQGADRCEAPDHTHCAAR